MAEDTVFYRIQIDGADQVQSSLVALTAESKQLSDQKKALTKQLDELNKAYRENTITQKEYDQQSKQLSTDIAQTNLQLKQNSSELSANQKSILDNAKATQVAEGSIEQMRLELAKAQKEYVKLSAEERNNAQVGGVLQQRIKAQSDELKDLEKNVGITSRSVGDYGQAVQGVLPIMGGFGQQINQVIGQLTGIKSALSSLAVVQTASATATNVASTAMKLFRIALISTGIGAIVVALGSLVAYFTSTQEGADKVTKFLRPLQEVFASLFGIIQDVGGAAFQVLGGYFDVFINTFKLGYRVFESGVLQMRIAWNNFTGDDLEAKQLTEELQNVNKEIEEAKNNIMEGQAEMQKGFAKMGEIASESADRIGEAYERGKVIADLEIEISKLEAIERLTLGRLQRERLAQKEIAEDNNKSLAERTKAAENEIELLNKITAFEKGILEKKEAKLRLEQEANDTNREGNKELNELIAQQEEIEARASEQRIEISKRLYATKKAEADNFKKKQEEALKESLKKEQDAIKKEIELNQLAREIESAQNDESDEEKYKKEVELQKKIFDLKIESAKKANEDTTILEQQRILALAKLEQEERNRKKELELKDEEERKAKEAKDLEEATKKSEEDAKNQEKVNAEARQKAEEFAEQTAKLAIDQLNQKNEREKEIELANLDAKLEQGLITQAEFEKQKLAIEKKAFQKKKKNDLAIVAIDLAKELSAIQANAAANPANAITFGGAGIAQATFLSGIAIAKSAINAGIIASQKFSRGGVAKGKSHLNGGIPFTVAGQGGYEMEGGEAIINKRSTAMFRNELSAINQAGGGVAFAKRGLALPNYSAVNRYPNGGIPTPIMSEMSNVNIKDEIVKGVVSSIQSIKVVNVATETTNHSSRVRDIEIQNSF